MITGRDITVWTISGVLAIGIGLSSYAKRKTRDKLVRELAAMEPERRQKVPYAPEPKARDGNPRAVNGTFSDNELTAL